MRNLSKTIVSKKVSLIQKETIMDMNIHSVCWLIIAVISFILALATDAELRAEMKNIRNVAGMIISLVALYYSIMWITSEWLTWCL